MRYHQRRALNHNAGFSWQAVPAGNGWYRWWWPGIFVQWPVYAIHEQGGKRPVIVTRHFPQCFACI
jgi:hypothetical protein